MLLNEKFTKPIGFNTRNTYLHQELPKCETVCYFIFNYLSENKLKVFRWKLLHFIIPTKGVIVSVLALSATDRWFESRSDQTKKLQNWYVLSLR